jgi:hypothetical protein
LSSNRLATVHPTPAAACRWTEFAHPWTTKPSELVYGWRWMHSARLRRLLDLIFVCLKSALKGLQSEIQCITRMPCALRCTQYHSTWRAAGRVTYCACMPPSTPARMTVNRKAYDIDTRNSANKDDLHNDSEQKATHTGISPHWGVIIVCVLHMGDYRVCEIAIAQELLSQSQITRNC